MRFSQKLWFANLKKITKFNEIFTIFIRKKLWKKRSYNLEFNFEEIRVTVSWLTTMRLLKAYALTAIVGTQTAQGKILSLYIGGSN